MLQEQNYVLSEGEKFPSIKKQTPPQTTTITSTTITTAADKNDTVTHNTNTTPNTIYSDVGDHSQRFEGENDDHDEKATTTTKLQKTGLLSDSKTTIADSTTKNTTDSSTTEENEGTTTETTETSTLGKVKLLVTGFLTSQLFCHSLLLLQQILFGGFGVIGPMSIKHFPHSIFFACLRAMIMALTIFPVSLILDWRHSFRHTQYSDRRSLRDHLLAKIPSLRDTMLLFVIGVNVLTNILTYVLAVSLTNYTIVAIIQPMATVFTCVFSILLRREGKSLVKILGVAFAVIGSVSMLLIITFFGDGSSSSSGNSSDSGKSSFNAKSLIGALVYLFNTFITATFLILQRVALDRKIPPFTVTSYSMLLAQGFALFIGAFWIKDFRPMTIPSIGWIGLVYSGIVIGSLGFALGSYSAKFTSPTVVSVYSTTAPIISVIFQYVFLSQTTTMYAIFGAMLITTGVIMVGYAKRKEELQQAKEQHEKELEKGEHQELEDMMHQQGDDEEERDVEAGEASLDPELGTKQQEQQE